jgi:hypothetical protein
MIGVHPPYKRVSYFFLQAYYFLFPAAVLAVDAAGLRVHYGRDKIPGLQFNEGGLKQKFRGGRNNHVIGVVLRLIPILNLFIVAFPEFVDIVIGIFKSSQKNEEMAFEIGAALKFTYK